MVHLFPAKKPTPHHVSVNMTRKSYYPALAAVFFLFFTLGMTSPVQDGFGEGSIAPEFEITADDGNTYTIASLTEDAPTFIVFWKESCPSNQRAAPLFKAIKDAYGEKANLVGVVTAPPERISDWAEQFQTNYPLLPNGDKSLIKDYDISRSITTYQIGTDGKILFVDKSVKAGSHGADIAAKLAELGVEKSK